MTLSHDSDQNIAKAQKGLSQLKTKHSQSPLYQLLIIKAVRVRTGQGGD